MNMKRILAAFLAAMMILSLAACGTAAPSAPESEGDSSVSVENAAVSLNASYGETFDGVTSINIYNEDGRYLLDYSTGMENQRGYVDAALMEQLTAIYQSNGLAELNGKEEYGDGEASGSIGMDFADGTSFSCMYAGEIPEAIVTAFTAMNEAVVTAMETMEPYRAQVDFAEDVDADAKAALDAIFAHLGNEALDMTMGMTVPTDDPNYAHTVGIEPSEQIANATVVQNMMGTVAHTITLLQLNEGADADAIQSTMMENADWRKWVCVAPDMGITAAKDNMVLFSMTLSDIGAELVAGLEAEGWTITANVENPDTL